MMIMIIINITEQNITHKGNKIRLIVSKITHKKSVKVKKELDLSPHTIAVHEILRLRVTQKGL